MYILSFNENIDLTAPLRGSTQQRMISFNRPHQAVSADTISRWCKDFLKQAGVDISKYKGHSIRAATTSYAANAVNSDLTRILLAAGWTSDNTFRRFYDLPYDSSFSVAFYSRIAFCLCINV